MGEDSGGGLSRKEIESHSSALFNKRINELYILVDNAEMECLNALIPSVQSAMGYYSSLMTLFMETSRMYESNKETSGKETDGTKKPTMQETIESCLKQSRELVKKLKGNNALQKDVEDLIETCLKWRYLMQNGMHNLNYFLRMSFQEPKGISEILKLFGGEDEIPGHNKQLSDKPEQEA